MKTVFNMTSGFSKNSPMWAKRLRIALATFFAGVIMYGDILAPALGIPVTQFDKLAGFGGFLSTVIFSMFGVEEEAKTDENDQ